MGQGPCGITTWICDHRVRTFREASGLTGEILRNLPSDGSRGSGTALGIAKVKVSRTWGPLQQDGVSQVTLAEAGDKGCQGN